MTPNPTLPERLLDIRTIDMEAEVESCPRGCEILARSPNADRIPAPRDAHAGHWLRAKQGAPMPGTRRGLAFCPDGCSLGLGAPSNGHAMAC